MGERQKRIGMGLVGPGFVAAHHLDAVCRIGDVDIIAIAGSSQEAADRKAKALRVNRAYGSYRDLVSDPDIDVVHVTTPNYLHFEVTLAAIEAGKHVISDKPLAMTYKESVKLRDAAQMAGVVNAVTFNYRGNSLIQQARLMIEKGDIGNLFFIHGHYMQDWMTDPAVYSWRSNPTLGGPSSALADIGSHWCDLAQHISGSKITSVMAEMTTVVKTRYASDKSDEAFSSTNGENRATVGVSGEDLASVLLRFENGAKGCFSVGQVIAGKKNACEIELNALSGSLRWNQERQNELWVGRYNMPNSMIGTDPVMLLPEARAYARLPAGHHDGWSDAFRNVIADIYSWIRSNGDPMSKPPTICTFADACQMAAVIEAMIRSSTSGGSWEPVAHESMTLQKVEVVMA